MAVGVVTAPASQAYYTWNVRFPCTLNVFQEAQQYDHQTSGRIKARSVEMQDRRAD